MFRPDSDLKNGPTPTHRHTDTRTKREKKSNFQMDEMEEKKRKKMVAVENRSWHLTGFHVHVSLNARPEQGSMESVLTAIHFLVWNLSAKS